MAQVVLLFAKEEYGYHHSHGGEQCAVAYVACTGYLSGYGAKYHHPQCRTRVDDAHLDREGEVQAIVEQKHLRCYAQGAYK